MALLRRPHGPCGHGVELPVAPDEELLHPVEYEPLHGPGEQGIDLLPRMAVPYEETGEHGRRLRLKGIV